jgi:hypothetical protein
MKQRKFLWILLPWILVALVACTPGGNVEPTATTVSTNPTIVAEQTSVAATATMSVVLTQLAATATPAVATPEAATATVPTPEAATPVGTAGFCPEVPRPALLIFVPGQQYVLVNPTSGQSCVLPFPDPLPGLLEVANGRLYYHVEEGDNLVVKQLSPDGTAQMLPFTAVNKMERSAYTDFAVSPDGRYIAWSAAGNKPDDPSIIYSDLWVAEIATGQITAHFQDFSEPNQGMRSLIPVRFSDDGNTLFYSLQPLGIGGSWVAFTGRYHSLYQTPSAGGVLTPIFDCASQGLFMCIGDFYLVNNQLANLVYTHEPSKEVIVLNGQGQVINTVAAEAEFIGFPMFSPSAELVFYSADLGESFPSPTHATLYRVAPPTGPAEVAANDPNLVLPQFFLDGNHLVTSYVMTDNNWGLAVADILNGSIQPLSQWPNATTVGVLP